MILRLGSYLFLAVLAVVATFAQLDRSSRFAPQLAVLVPPAFSGFAAEQRTRAHVEAREGDAALAEARALVAKRPLPAEHLALLSFAATLEDDEPLALAAMEASAVRGWRAPVAQFASARAALSSRAYDIAAQRISALLATGEMSEQARQLLAELITTPEGRSAMAQRYVARGHWQANSLPSAFAEAAPRDTALLLAEALEAGAPLPCARLRLVADRFAGEDNAIDRALFWPRDCPAN